MGRGAPTGLIVAENRTEYKGNLPPQQHFRLEDRRHGLGIGQLAGHTQLHRLVEGQAHRLQKLVRVRMRLAEGQLTGQEQVQRLAIAAGRGDQCPQIRPRLRRGPDLLLQLPLGRDEGVLARLPLAGGYLLTMQSISKISRVM